LDFIRDLSLLVFGCVAMFSLFEFKAFLGTLIGGLFLGLACWMLCSRYSRLWNLSYRVTVTHHVLCGIAAVLTILFTVTFVSLKYTKPVTEALITAWQLQLLADLSWEQKAFRKTYEAIKALGVEDFTNYPHPDRGGHIVPASEMVSRRTLASIYSSEAVKHFHETHPYLSMVLSAEPGISPGMITDDVSAFFSAHPQDNYSNLSAVKLAADHIRQGLNARAPRVVPISRGITVVLFILVQSIPFSAIGVAAYRDLKVIT
jgi:hypothetical protein